MPRPKTRPTRYAPRSMSCSRLPRSIRTAPIVTPSPPRPISRRCRELGGERCTDGADRVDERPREGSPRGGELERDLRKDVETLTRVEERGCVPAARDE